MEVKISDLKEVTDMLDKISNLKFERLSRHAQIDLQQKAVKLSDKIKKDYTGVKKYYI